MRPSLPTSTCAVVQFGSGSDGDEPSDETDADGRGAEQPSQEQPSDERPAAEQPADDESADEHPVVGEITDGASDEEVRRAIERIERQQCQDAPGLTVPRLDD